MPSYQTRSLACPSGQSGTRNQRRDWVASPYPSCGAWGSYYDTLNTCTPNPPASCTNPAPSTPATCPAGQSGGTWTQAAYPDCGWSVTGCSPSACTNPAPSTTPACPSGGNQTGGSWSQAPYPGCSWTYSGGSCPPPPSVTSYPFCNGRSSTTCMNTVHAPPMGGPPAQGGFIELISDKSDCGTTGQCRFDNDSDWSISWSGMVGAPITSGCASSGNGANNQCTMIGSCSLNYTATATVRHIPSNTTRTYNFSYSCEVIR